MWHNDKSVQWAHCKSGSQAAWAMIEDINGWKRIRTGAPDGVTNLYAMLTIAKANNRKVDVFIKNDMIEEVTLR